MWGSPYGQRRGKVSGSLGALERGGGPAGNQKKTKMKMRSSLEVIEVSWDAELLVEGFLVVAALELLLTELLDCEDVILPRKAVTRATRQSNGVGGGGL